MNESIGKNRMTIHFAMLAIAAILCTFIFTWAIKSRVKNEKMISVFGYASKNFTSDLVVWNGSFTRKSMNLQTAYEELDKDKTNIRSFLITHGIAEKELVFSAIEILKESENSYDKTGNTVSVFTGYKLTQKISIESKEVDKVEEVSRKVTELINKGVEFYSENPQYYYTRLADLKLQLISEASEDGRKRAEAIALKSKVKLGKLKYANTDVFQITAQYSSETYTYGGVFNTSSRSKSATINIKIQYEIQ